MSKSKKAKVWKIVGIVFGAFILLVIVANIFVSDEDLERLEAEEKARVEAKLEAKALKEAEAEAKSQANAEKKAMEKAQKEQKQADNEAEKRATEAEKNPVFATQWERLEHEIRQAKLLGIGKTTAIKQIKMNTFHEDLLDPDRDRRIILIYLTDTNPRRTTMLGNVSQLLQIMYPYKDIYEIAIFFETEDSAGTWLKYAIDGEVLRKQNPDHFRVDDLPKIASDYYLYPQLK